MNVNGMKIDELMTLGDTMRSMKKKMMPKMALWYSPTMRNNYNMPSQMDMNARVNDRDIFSRQQVNFQTIIHNLIYVVLLTPNRQ